MIAILTIITIFYIIPQIWYLTPFNNNIYLGKDIWLKFSPVFNKYTTWWRISLFGINITIFKDKEFYIRFGNIELSCEKW